MDRESNFHDESLLNIGQLLKPLEKVGDRKFVIISIIRPPLKDSRLLRNVLCKFLSEEGFPNDILDTIDISKNLDCSDGAWKISVSEPIRIPRDGGDIFIILLGPNYGLEFDPPFDVMCNIFATCMLLSSIFIIQTDYLTDLHLQYFSEYTEVVRQLARKNDSGNGVTLTLPKKLMYFVQDSSKTGDVKNPDVESKLSNQAGNSKCELNVSMSTTFSGVAVFIDTPTAMLITGRDQLAKLNSALKYFPEGFDDMCFSFETLTENLVDSEVLIRNVTRLSPHLCRAAHLHRIRASPPPLLFHSIPKIIAVNVGMHAYQAEFKKRMGDRCQLVDSKKFYSWHNEGVTVALKSYTSILTVNAKGEQDCNPYSDLGGRLQRLYRNFMSSVQKFQGQTLQLNVTLTDYKRKLRMLADEEYETRLNLLSNVTHVQLNAAKKGVKGVVEGQKEISLLLEKVDESKQSLGQSQILSRIETVQDELSRVDDNFYTNIVGMLDNIPITNAVWAAGVLEKLCQHDEPRYMRDTFGKFRVWSTSYTKRQAEEIQSRLALILRRSVYFRRYLDMLSAHPMVGLSTSQQIIVRDNVTAKEYHSACQAIIAFWVGKAGENAQIGSLLRVLEQIGWNSAKGKILGTDWSAILTNVN
ncbi:uncharacterized protein LOC110855653 [Folsomia candida]|uniref:uncharacterized protein LOC110855653 n=1 Tax=Folsomia candida TaxID=158441 RepID=UPI000B8F2C3B|nr:uncharacterized protein LOC110855653 [Folsomia candida]